jgi:hypothetical protein
MYSLYNMIHICDLKETNSSPVLNVVNTKPFINYKKAVCQNVMKSYFALMLQCISCCYVKSVIDPLHSHKQQDFFSCRPFMFNFV